MSKKKEAGRRPSPSARAPLPGPRPLYWILAGAALLAVWWAYSPALHGPFLFDDTALPFALPNFSAPLSVWLKNYRPLLMFTYWVNSVLSGHDTFSFHVVNVLFHCATAALVFAIVRRLAEWSGAMASRRDLLAGFAAAVFLLHPVQTEAVAYLAGRSEGLSVLFAYAAFAIFLYRPEPRISWRISAAVLALFLMGLASKEHIVALPALFLLTDVWWNPGSALKAVRGNWRLYAPMAAGALAGVAYFWQLILHSPSAGFGLKDLPWYQYLFTQFRALFVYLRLFVLPAGQDLDWDFPLSRTLLDRGSLVGLLVLAALIAAAFYYRRRFPLATYGFLAFLVLMAPTSSILPIKDPVAERRLYFSMLGLLLIVVDWLARVKMQRRTLGYSCAAVVLVLAFATHARAALWSDPVALWEDTVRKSPNKSRTHFQLAVAYTEAQRYDAALAEFQKTAQLVKPDYNLLVDWGLAYDALNRPDEAIATLRRAAAIEPTAHVYSQIGMIYAKQRRYPEALDALNRAEKIDPGWAPTFNYRAKIFFQQNEYAAAIADYRRALAIDPTLVDARDELARAEAMQARAGH
jgi:tetratricopeptide (TPR) repeat protein